MNTDNAFEKAAAGRWLHAAPKELHMLTTSQEA